MVFNKRNLESSVVSEWERESSGGEQWRVGDARMVPASAGGRLTSALLGWRGVVCLSGYFPYPNV